ncbi:MAG: NYN domain-containing protein [Nitrospinota bacterium]|nr:NYN domain-containing protein [Nitrospinota bacterium]
MKILIDGYNLIHTIPAIAQELDRDLESSRNSLIRLLHSYRSSKNDIYPITVVFDGQKEHLDKRNTPPRGINITYSRGETADELIVKMVKNEYKGSILVTSDRELRRNAEPFVNTLFYSEEFAERIFMSTFNSEKSVIKEDQIQNQKLDTKKKGNPRRPSKRERHRNKFLRKL